MGSPAFLFAVIKCGLLARCFATEFDRFALALQSVNLYLLIMRPPRLFYLSAVLALASSLQAADVKLAFKEDAHGVSITVNDKPFASYVIDQSNKPYLWPVYGPTGKAMTRAFPMQEVDSESKVQRDHYHHRGITFGHESIAGFDSWAEAGTFADNLKNPAAAETAQKRIQMLGSIKHVSFTSLKAQGDKAVISERCEYLDASGKRLFSEDRTMTFSATSETRSIDFDQDLIATDGDISLDDRKDAGLSIRVPSSMAVDSKQGGKILNSEGVEDKEAWSKAAKWCAYTGPVEGETLGVAFLNHPSSFRYPTRWHVRTYGLFTANPFASKQYDKALPDAAFVLKNGERLKLRHRMIFHKADVTAPAIEKMFDSYSKETR